MGRLFLSGRRGPLCSRLAVGTPFFYYTSRLPGYDFLTIHFRHSRQRQRFGTWRTHTATSHSSHHQLDPPLGAMAVAFQRRSPARRRHSRPGADSPRPRRRGLPASSAATRPQRRRSSSGGSGVGPWSLDGGGAWSGTSASTCWRSSAAGHQRRVLRPRRCAARWRSVKASWTSKPRSVRSRRSPAE